MDLSCGPREEPRLPFDATLAFFLSRRSDSKRALWFHFPTSRPYSELSSQTQRSKETYLCNMRVSAPSRTSREHPSASSALSKTETTPPRLDPPGTQRRSPVARGPTTRSPPRASTAKRSVLGSEFSTQISSAREGLAARTARERTKAGNFLTICQCDTCVHPSKPNPRDLIVTRRDAGRSPKECYASE